MDEARERILTAAVEAAAVHGVRRLSVADVARRAGLSRPTLYKHFPSKDGLVAAAVRREADAIVAAVRAAVDAAGPDPRAALEAGVLVALRLLREHPLLDRVVRTEPEALAPLLATDDARVLAAVRLPVEQMIADRFPGLGPVATRRIADLLTRTLVSYALSAPDDPPEVVAATVAALVVDGARSLPAVLAQVTEEGR